MSYDFLDLEVGASEFLLSYSLSLETLSFFSRRSLELVGLMVSSCVLTAWAILGRLRLLATI